MIPSFLISLKSRSDRRENALNWCKKFNFTPEIIDAVDLRSYSNEELKNFCTLPLHKAKKKQRWLMAGEIGCALSHKKIYEIIVKQNISYALVIEDDVEFIDDISQIAKEEELNLIKDKTQFDILVLGYVKTQKDWLSDYYKSHPLRVLHSQNGRIFGTPWHQYGCGTVAYIISLEGAKKMLNATKNICVPADDYKSFWHLYGVKTLHVQPSYALESQNISSDIGDGRVAQKDSKPNIIRKNLLGALKYFAMNFLHIQPK